MVFRLNLTSIEKEKKLDLNTLILVHKYMSYLLVFIDLLILVFLFLPSIKTATIVDLSLITNLTIEQNTANQDLAKKYIYF